MIDDKAMLVESSSSRELNELLKNHKELKISFLK